MNDSMDIDNMYHYFQKLTGRKTTINKKAIAMGSLRNISPVSKVFGLDRGHAIDRYYIESFLAENKSYIKNVVLEIGDSEYTKKYGDGQVVRSEVLHAVAGNPHATIVGSLSTGEGIPDNAFDCMILTQTIHCIYDIKSVILNSYRALKPGGIILATLPGISQISRYDMDRWGDYWRFTTLSAKKLFEEAFPAENITIKSYGNVLVAISFLEGLSLEELDKSELDYTDEDYQVLITVRAQKPL